MKSATALSGGRKTKRAAEDRRSPAAAANRIRRLQEAMGRLGDLALGLSAERGLDGVAREVLTAGCGLLGCDSARFYLVERTAGKAAAGRRSLSDKRLVLKGARKDPAQDARPGALLGITDRSLAGVAALRGKLLLVPDARKLPRSAPYRGDPLLASGGPSPVLSALAVPVLGADRKPCVVLLFAARGRRSGTSSFGEDGPALARVLADQTAAALARLAGLEMMHKLDRVGAALSQERDLDRLLELILTSARELTDSDAGSLYLIEKAKEKNSDPDDFLADKCLWFKLAQNDSLTVPFQERRLAITEKSVAGHVALTGEPLSLADTERLPRGATYRVDRSFDKATGYRTVSMLCVPMKNHRGELLGVLQLINRRRFASTPLGLGGPRKDVIPYGRDSAEHALSLAGQAAVAIENSRLYFEIRALFDTFVQASVGAIEERDPTTSGHSDRVAALMLVLADAVNRTTTGPYSHQKFSADEKRQLQVASLLHDFGKIGVREAVLVKPHKLYPYELTVIEHRKNILALQMKLQAARRRLDALSAGSAGERSLQDIERSLGQALELLEADLGEVRKANLPMVVEGAAAERLQDLARRRIDLPDAEILALINEEEARRLGVRRGSLSEEERREIESHVVHTKHYLDRIPWPKHLGRVPEIAYAHHERLDGKGYPEKLTAEAIPVESKMMGVCDIYDALTASDRPYKKALQPERALAILEAEARAGAIDGELVRIFIAERVFDAVRRPPQAR